MPYVDLYSTDDFAAIWYTTNSSYGNTGGFHPDKPTVIILHPTFLDSQWLHHQFGDPRLDSTFNLIAFDMRVCGRSSCRPSGRHDSWVDAADLAFAIQALHLSPAHILALESMAVNCALRFAVLFPEMCLSLTLCNVPSPIEVKWVFTAYDELLRSWCSASDLETFEHVAMEASNFVAGPECDPDLQDDLIAYWEMEMPPTKSQRIIEQLNVVMNRLPLKPNALAEITQPVLIIHGERNEACPRKSAEKLVSELVNVQGGAVLYTVKGASGCLSIVPGSASIMNQVFVKFVSRLPKTRSDPVPPSVPIRERMLQALNQLAELMEDESLRQRDPLSSLSFSCLSPDLVKSQVDALRHYGKIQRRAFSPLGPDGRPTRRYSERKRDHWFHGEKDGLSYAGTALSARSRQKQEHEPERQEKFPSTTDHISYDQTPELRVHRPAFNPSTADKHTVKSSMTRVITSPPVRPFQRLVA